MSDPVTRIFICTNQRAKPLSCGLRADTRGLAHRLRASLEKCGPTDRFVQVVESRCLGRCPHGPVMITMPDRTWYGYDSLLDLETIADEHVRDGRPVERLTIEERRRGSSGSAA